MVLVVQYAGYDLMKRIVIRKTVRSGGEQTAVEFLSGEAGLSKTRIKDAMNKGAVWIQKGGKKYRLRKATALLRRGTYIEMHYDERLLSVVPPLATCLADMKEYSGWFKPAGLMSQGTLPGDHCSVLRQAEQSFSPKRDIFLVHRLDREVSGVMIIAHTRRAARSFSMLFRDNRVEKRYRAEVFGDISSYGGNGVIEIPLDGKEAKTVFTVLSHNRIENTSQVEVVLVTGRFHQIRRHFDLIGHPVMGDPRYGKGNKNREGVRLEAVLLRFLCPVTGKETEISMPSEGQHGCCHENRERLK